MTRIMQGWAAGLIGLVMVQQVLFSPTVEAATDGCFKSVYAFGDGMFDTGSISAVFPSILNYDYPPYGSTFFEKPSGRFSDGRLVLDFLSEALDLPRIPSYAQTVVSDFSSGISFGSAFSTIGKVSTGQTAGEFMFLNPFALPVQYLHYAEFRQTTGQVIKKAIKAKAKRALLQEGPEVVQESAAVARLPGNADFDSGLHLFSIGAHDIVNWYNLKLNTKQIEGKLQGLVDGLGLVIRALCKSATGVKNLIVFDVEPLGCQPFLLTLIPHTPEDLDPKGCLIAQNALVQKYNKLLKASVEAWRSSYKKNIYYLSQYDIKIDLMNDISSGFTTTNMACCGVPGTPHNVLIPVPCGPPVFDPATNQTILATSCPDPSTYLYWDGMYTTEAANKYVTQKILSGEYFDIPFPALTSCAKPLS